MFFSKEQIEQSIARLDKLNPFFGTVLLAFKKARLPVDTTKSINFKEVVEDILQTYYPSYPADGEPANRKMYTPFKTSKKSDRWNKYPYAGTLRRIADDTFKDVVDHPGGRDWGWKSNYIDALGKKHLRDALIPTFDLAVWLFRSHRWENNVRPSDVIEFFFREFHITEAERALFSLSIPSLGLSWRESALFNNLNWS